MIDRSANLTDALKMEAEYFDNKLVLLQRVLFQLLGTVPGPITNSIPWQQSDITYVALQVDITGGNSLVIAWNAKTLYDRIRPISVIRGINPELSITSWGGIRRGTVRDVKRKEWQSYLRTMPHSQFPSGTTCFCSAAAQNFRRIFEGDLFPGGSLTFTLPVGSSAREPGCVPSQPITLQYNTWTQWELQCGESRIWAGVHFRDSVQAARQTCPQIGNFTYDFVNSYWMGTASAPIDPLDRDVYSP